MLVLIAAGLVAAPSAHAETVTIGEANPAADPGGDCGLCAALQTSTAPTSPSYVVPQGAQPWVLTSFSTREDGNPTVGFRLLLAEPAGGSNYTLRIRTQGSSTLPNTLNTFIVRLRVQPGWILGLNTGSNGGTGRNAGLGDVFSVYNNAAVDTTAALGMPFNGSLLNIQATLESDCDADGLGDDTQDADLTSCDPGGGPDTTITKGPKAKTKKKKAKFKFSRRPRARRSSAASTAAPSSPAPHRRSSGSSAESTTSRSALSPPARPTPRRRATSGRSRRSEKRK